MSIIVLKIKRFLSGNSYLLLIALISLVSLTWFKSDFIFNGDFGYFDVNQSFIKDFFRWDGYSSSGVVNTQDSLFYFGFLIPFKLLGYLFSFPVSERIMFYLWMLSAGWGAYYLCRVMDLEKVTGFFAGCLYIFNVYSMIWVFHYGSGGTSFSYVYLPFILALFIKGFKERRGFGYALIANLILLLGFGVVYVNVVYVAVIWGVIGAYLLYSLFSSANYIDRLLRLRLFVYYGLVYLVLNLFWFIPFVLESSTVVHNIFLYAKDNSALEKLMLVSYKPSGLFNLLGFWALHENFKGHAYYSFSNYYLNPIIIIISYLLPILVFVVPLFSRKKLTGLPDLLFWYALSLLSLLLVGGARIPGISNVFLQLFNQSAFISSGFRNISTKIGPVLLLGYAILFGFSAYYMASKFKKRFLRSVCYGTLFILFIVILPLPLWQGKHLPDINGFFPAAHVKIPEAYWQVRQILANQKLDYRVSTLPVIEYYGTTLQWNYGYSAANFYSAVFNKSVLSKNIGLPYVSVWQVGEMVAKRDYSDASLKLLSFYNTKYSLYLSDTAWDVVAGNNEIAPEERKVAEDYYNYNNRLLTLQTFDQLKLYKLDANYFLPHVYTPQSIITSDLTVKQLLSLVRGSDYQIRSAIFLANQNIDCRDAYERIGQLSNKTRPILEFKRINPIKYRVRIHGAKATVPLIFSESFNGGWKTYLIEYKKESLNFVDSDYKILDGNEDDQASTKELKSLIDKGYVSSLGDLKAKLINHTKRENNKEVFDYSEKYKIDFISKNFQDTIQNDNLENGNFYETWLEKPVNDNRNHLMVNGYANSWIIDPAEICRNNSKCLKNSDDSYDLELILEFWPQRLFYMGGGISVTALTLCVSYLIYRTARKRGKKNSLTAS